MLSQFILDLDVFGQEIAHQSFVHAWAFPSGRHGCASGPLPRRRELIGQVRVVHALSASRVEVHRSPRVLQDLRPATQLLDGEPVRHRVSAALSQLVLEVDLLAWLPLRHVERVVLQLARDQLRCVHFLAPKIVPLLLRLVVFGLDSGKSFEVRLEEKVSLIRVSFCSRGALERGLEIREAADRVLRFELP